MWRPRLVVQNSNFFAKSLYKNKLYFATYPPKGNNKNVFRIIASSSLAIVGVIVYAKYEPRLKHFLGINLPYIDRVFKFPDDKPEENDFSGKTQTYFEKGKALNFSLEKLYAIRSLASDILNSFVVKLNQKQTKNGRSEDKKIIDETKLIETELKETESTLKSFEMKEDITSYEDNLYKTILKLKKILGEAIYAHRLAANAIKYYVGKQNAALELNDCDYDKDPWIERNDARREKDEMLNFAREKTAEIKIVFENLKNNAERLSELGVDNFVVKNGEKIASKCLFDLQKADEMRANEEQEEAREVAEFAKVLKVIKELFERELVLVLPNRIEVDKESDLNLFIIHAHNKIEQLQQQIAKLQETEKLRIEEQEILQEQIAELQEAEKMRIEGQELLQEQIAELQEVDKIIIDKVLTKQKIMGRFLSDDEKAECLLELKEFVEDRFATLKDDFELQLHKLLFQQVTAHADHLQKSLEIQEKELNRKHRLELEEKLLHQKETFVSETSQNIARLNGIIEYLKTMNECNKSTERMQVLWLVCQAMCHKIKSESLSPLAKDIEKIKTIMGEDDDFVRSIVDSIPAVALNRGVFSVGKLKHRFEKIKDASQKVALVDENNDSIYRYILSHLQSLLIIDTAPSKDAVDAYASKWNTFDILKKIHFCLQTENLEQALYYADQLKGEPRVVAEDWINELRYLLETQLAFEALLAYTAAISIQAYH